VRLYQGLAASSAGFDPVAWLFFGCVLTPLAVLSWRNGRRYLALNPRRPTGTPATRQDRDRAFAWGYARGQVFCGRIGAIGGAVALLIGLIGFLVT
jgi:hypothetical protein